MSAFSSLPLFPTEVLARNHAILCTVGFLILLPLGTLLARYARTFTNRWFFGHAIIQLFLSGPVIFAGWHYGWKAADELELGHFEDPHTKMGLALLILYVIQLVWGLFIHFVKTPSPFGPGTRPPQNYFHAFLGLVILILAQEQVHYGLWTEWPTTTGNIHTVPQSAKHAWIALVVVFWVLYIAGLALVPRQFGQESRAREKA
ncbi:hypothetical protein D9758_014359 [Tetrapyrgos nigripes]|uniref:Cytochrome b561 domain-containing protein n=1 Tax=Tetrapyrgos nigripes TaxID=182062 RepID=A0A8H5C7Q7_9AGAR|nr:hypothetical protein D9758_014359 [Tetrapyrgos nigripes]